ncbi:hypothetical protein C8J57DRAFT_1519322 [Mycena rebaudengoi]|nr:hypothetical protein C8J57DRAFT_1519322 [Mycena rebaudengoi]
MPPKRKFTTSYEIDFGPESQPAAPASGSAPALALDDRMLQQSSTVLPGGGVVHDVAMVPFPASPSKQRQAGVRDLVQSQDGVGLEDEAIYEAQGPLYDLPADDDEDSEDDDGDTRGRELRDSDHPLKQWVLDHRDEFLDELLRWEGRGVHKAFETCTGCKREKPGDKKQQEEKTADNEEEKVADHRCIDCVGGGQLLCKDCLVERHRQLPLHRVQVWTGEFFSRTTLRALGLRMQLGHWEGSDHRCALPTPVRDDRFVIMDEHGIHQVSVDFCGCGTGGSHNTQLLRSGLYPATTTNPRTAATLTVLRVFHLLSFESKCSSYEFYHTLARESDNSGLDPPQNRYHEWRRMTREWRNLQMLKRAGRGHDATGPAGTSPGECALLCPACPQPGKNLPLDWEKASEEQKFLYALFLAMDANFRLKRKDVSTEEKDPGLGPGWAFYCEVNEYMGHISRNAKEPQERSRCVSHDAVDRPDKEARGTASSGIGAVDCARHNMKRPSAVGDLQVGERYINMDFMFLASIKGTELQRFYVSYDIACQWHINLWARMAKYDPDIRFLRRPQMGDLLGPQFSFNLTRYVGQTDGEAPERGWANTNPLAGSTKEMGPGSRRDTLDNHFNDWNHKKIIAFGRIMLRKMQAAVPEMVEARVARVEMEASLEQVVVSNWTAMAEEWEKDRTKPNPFETLHKDSHLARVRYELAKEAAEREEAGQEDKDAVRADMHITEWLAMGVQLEEQQRVLGFDVAATGLHPTDTQRRVMVERTSKLRRKILAWMVIQTQFFPVVARIRELEDAARMRVGETQALPGVLCHNIALWLPSALMGRAGATREEMGCKTRVLEAEYRLRVGQAHETLHNVRRQLLVRTHLYKQKDAEERGVKANTRAQGKIDILNEQIRRAAERYRGARRALVVLGRVLEKNEWEVALKPLAETDVRGMPRAHFGDEERQAARGKGKGKGKPSKKRRKVEYKVLSWIWLAPKQSARDPDVASEEGEQPAMDEALRIEWARTRARHLRWTEEVLLLEEEMRRIVQFLQWQAEWWRKRVGLRDDKIDDIQREGDRAYAMRQAALKDALAASFLEKWKDLPVLVRKARAGEDVEMRPSGVSEEAEAAETDSEVGSEGEEAWPVPATSKRDGVKSLSTSSSQFGCFSQIMAYKQLIAVHNEDPLPIVVLMVC